MILCEFIDMVANILNAWGVFAAPGWGVIVEQFLAFLMDINLCFS
jgi:hypothetical protein